MNTELVQCVPGFVSIMCVDYIYAILYGITNVFYFITYFKKVTQCKSEVFCSLHLVDKIDRKCVTIFSLFFNCILN